MLFVVTVVVLMTMMMVAEVDVAGGYGCACLEGVDGGQLRTPCGAECAQ